MGFPIMKLILINDGSEQYLSKPSSQLNNQSCHKTSLNNFTLLSLCLVLFQRLECYQSLLFRIRGVGRILQNRWNDMKFQKQYFHRAHRQKKNPKPSSLTYIQFEYECKSHSICISDSKLLEPVSCKKQQKKVPNQLLVCGTGDL